MTADSTRDLEPYDRRRLEVGGGHDLSIEQAGDPHGLPVLVIHGGPASGSSPRHRRFFDPSRYRIVSYDQRGSGRSTPAGGLQANGTPELVADIERIRTALGIERWLVFGGSWGATLALVYAGLHRDRCLGLVLRGVFLAESGDLDWFFHGAARLLPDAWASFEQRVPRPVGQSLMAGCLEALARADEDPDRAARVTAAWLDWEAALTRPGGTPAASSAPADPAAVRKYRLQAAYLARQCDLADGAVLESAAAACGLPAALVHGRLDFVCRPDNGWRVAGALSGSRLRLIAGAGHDPYHPEMAAALRAATDEFARAGSFERLGPDWIRR